MVTAPTWCPDFTAEYLHKTSEFLAKRYQGAPVSGLSARDRVAAELHENTYDESADIAALERAESRGARNDGRRTINRSFSRRKAAAAPKQTGSRIEMTFGA